MHRFKIGLLLACIVMLTACADNANSSEDTESVQPETYSTEKDNDNSAIKSGEDDNTGSSSETTQVDDKAEDTIDAAQPNDTSEKTAETSQPDNLAEDSAETAETGESDDADTVYLKPCNSYQDILDNVYEVIVADYTTNVVESDDAFTYVGVAETRIGRNVEETLASVGYTLYDVDGNGVDELIIVDTSETGSPWNNRILIMASLLDNKPVEVAGGWARNRFYLLNDNTIYYEGSGGAAYTTFATYRMAEDGISLEVIDYYFSDYRDDSLEEYWLVEGNWGWFHNTTGGYKDESEWIEFENEEVPWEMQEAYIAQVKDLDLTFFETLRQ